MDPLVAADLLAGTFPQVRYDLRNQEGTTSSHLWVGAILLVMRHNSLDMEGHPQLSLTCFPAVHRFVVRRLKSGRWKLPPGLLKEDETDAEFVLWLKAQRVEEEGEENDGDVRTGELSGGFGVTSNDCPTENQLDVFGLCSRLSCGWEEVTAKQMKKLGFEVLLEKREQGEASLGWEERGEEWKGEEEGGEKEGGNEGEERVGYEFVGCFPNYDSFFLEACRILLYEYGKDEVAFYLHKDFSYEEGVLGVFKKGKFMKVFDNFDKRSEDQGKHMECDFPIYTVMDDYLFKEGLQKRNIFSSLFSFDILRDPKEWAIFQEEKRKMNPELSNFGCSKRVLRVRPEVAPAVTVLGGGAEGEEETKEFGEGLVKFGLERGEVECLAGRLLDGLGLNGFFSIFYFYLFCCCFIFIKWFLSFLFNRLCF